MRISEENIQKYQVELQNLKVIIDKYVNENKELVG